MASNPRFDPYAAEGLTAPAPLSGTPNESMQRLRIGLGGLLGIVIIVGLATMIYDQANQVDATTVPDAAPTTEASPIGPKNDPLANAGVVPDLPAEPPPEPDSAAASQPAQGNGVPAQ